MDKLENYRKKRDFSRTAEPYGEREADPGRARTFAVQFHLARRAHFDLRLEWAGALLSWAVPKGPSLDPRDRRLAVRVEDHPLEYASFEGTIPRGEYGGGVVQLWDEGRWLPLGEVGRGLEAGSLKFTLFGSRLKGSWTLVRMEGENWLWIKERDAFARAEPGIAAFRTGIRSGLTPEEIASRAAEEQGEGGSGRKREKKSDRDEAPGKKRGTGRRPASAGGREKTSGREERPCPDPSGEGREAEESKREEKGDRAVSDKGREKTSGQAERPCPDPSVEGRAEDPERGESAKKDLRSRSGRGGKNGPESPGGRGAGTEAADKEARAARNPPGPWLPMLAVPAAKVPTEPGWLYEVKYDGWRMLAVCEGGRVRLLSRSGREWTDFKEISEPLAAWAGDRAMVLDGELAAAGGDGRTDFQALRRRERSKALVYPVFDLLALDGEDWRARPLQERKQRLEALLADAPAVIRYSRHVEGQGEDCLRAARALELEGIVGKRADAPYRAGRSPDWIKLKCGRRQEFVIGGFSRSPRRKQDFSALLLGCYEDGLLRYAGKVGTGFDDPARRALSRTFEKLLRKRPPFADPPKAGPGESLFWLKPSLVCEVRFAERTAEGLIRQGSFKGLRGDKVPQEVGWEEPGPAFVPEEKASRTEEAPAKRAEKTAKARPSRPEPEEVDSPSSLPGTKGAERAGETCVPVDEMAPKRAKAKRASERIKSPSARSKELEIAEDQVALFGAKKAARAGEGAEAGEGGRKGRSKPAKGAAVKDPAMDAESPREEAAGPVRVGGTEISSPARPLFAGAGVSKLEAARYYEAAAGRMLAYLFGRPVSAVRCHGNSCFFRKHPDGPGEGIELVRLDEGAPYFCLRSPEGLLREVQLGTVEFHAWACRADAPERPDVMTFDLDPDEGLPVALLREGVRELKAVLDGLGLVSFLKASGGKGFHVAVPFVPRAGWAAFAAFARKTAELLQKSRPDLFTVNLRKQSRKGKIFLDFLRNKRGATAVAPWSLRARPGTRAAVPLRWEELDEAEPGGFDLSSALARLKEPDPWRNFFRVGQSLSGEALSADRK